jgi:LCP family protein required for cell wall assembly
MTNRREQDKKETKETLLNLVGWILSVIQLVTSVLAIVLLCKADFLPTPLLVAAVVVLAVLFVLCRYLMKRKTKKGKFIIGIILSVIVSVIMCAASFYLYQLTNTLQNITDATEETTRVGVYVLADDSAQTMQDALGYEFGILENLARLDTDNAVAQINDENQTDILTVSYEGTAELAQALLNQDCQAIIMNEAFLNLITESDEYDGFDSQIREIASYEWKTTVTKTTEEKTDSDESEEVTGTFTMFISGIDTAGDISTRSRSDVNILAVVNTDTRQILLVSTPRDYYVPLSISNGVPDKLTHAGIYGIDVSMDTLEMLYDIDIDYYFRINFSGFEQLIDALGGVTVQSDYTFDVAPSFHYEKGSNELSGIEALAFARERHAFAEGDRQRGKNQMAVITGVINKMQSPAILQNFSGLMQGLEGSFETDMPYSVISGLVKDQISDNTSWNVVSYSVDGTGSKSTTYSMNQQLYVMIPDETTVETAKNMMEQVKNGEIVESEQ